MLLEGYSIHDYVIVPWNEEEEVVIQSDTLAKAATCKEGNSPEVQ